MASQASISIVHVGGLVFDYPGKRALDGVTLDVAPNSITALIGPNGAGKTTLFKCIAALLTPLAGHVTIDGIDAHAEPRRAHRRLGYMADFFGLYDRLTVAQCLRHRAGAQRIPADRAAAAVERAAAQVGLGDRMEQRAGELSRGYRQRLALAQAIIHRPAVLLLDEPASGLDPGARAELSALLRTLADDGATIVVSSHILSELEDYSTHVLILNDGRVVEHSALGAARDGPVEMMLALTGPDGRLTSLLDEAGIRNVEIGGATASFSMPADPEAHRDLLRKLVEAGLPVAAFGVRKDRLHDVYAARMGADGGDHG